MSQNTHIPATVVKISALPEEVPTHLVGVSISTGKTVKYPATSLSNLLGIERRHDLNVYSYCGKAPKGSLESDPVWTITRIEILEDGTTNKVTLNNVAWSSRYSLTYS